MATLERDRRGREHVVALGAPEPGGGGARDGAEGERGVLDVEGIEPLRERGAQVPRGGLGRGGERRAQQDDAEIGIGADRGQRRFDGVENALPIRAPECDSGRRPPRRSGRSRMPSCRALGEDVNVAGLRSVELVATGRRERGGDRLRRHGHACAPGRAWAASAAMRSPARIGAMRSRVTFCRPDQAGMLLTSSTVGRPSAP